MAENSAIEWTDHTWSPWIGCQKVGPGCDHCYAESLNKRTGGGNWGQGAPRRRTSAAYWRKPYRWNAQAAGTKVFPSMCDPFDNAVADEWRRDFGWVIRETPNLTWILLTKRIGNAAPMLADMFAGPTPDNVWLGATMVNQVEVDRDWAKLAASDARQVFVSVEPMLGPVVLPSAFLRLRQPWIIAGGESGPGARPMHPDWARSLRDQCVAAGVPFFMKQMTKKAPIPDDLLIRECPHANS